MPDQQSPNRSSIVERIHAVRQRIVSACDNAHRDTHDVHLLAVSKRHSVKAIQQAYDAGIASFGENYAQEGAEKVQQLKDLHATWHFIGKLQSNKLKLIVQHFDWVQTVTEQKHLRIINELSMHHKKQTNVCIQIKLGDEDSKNGVDIKQAKALLAYADQCAGIRPRGLMAIPPASEDSQQQLEIFQPIRQWFIEMQQQWPYLDTLSIGMSNDLEAAVVAGSTMVRVGTAIFGPRE